MSTQVESNVESSFLLRVLRIDGIFATASGLMTVLLAGFIAGLLDVKNDGILLLIGALVLGYGVGLLLLARPASTNRKVAIGAITLNLSWVAVSYLGLLLGWFEVNTAGKWAIALIAEAVLGFALLEYIGLRRQQ